MGKMRESDMKGWVTLPVEVLQGTVVLVTHVVRDLKG
jgi:hypothetical protein